MKFINRLKKLRGIYWLNALIHYHFLASFCLLNNLFIDRNNYFSNIITVKISINILNTRDFSGLLSLFLKQRSYTSSCHYVLLGKNTCLNQKWKFSLLFRSNNSTRAQMCINSTECNDINRERRASMDTVARVVRRV